MLVISCEMERHCRSDRFLMICIDLSWFLSHDFCCLEKSFGDVFRRLGDLFSWRFHRQCSSSLTSSVPGFAAPCPSSYVLEWQGTRNGQNLYRILEWNCLKLIVVLDINFCLHSIIITVYSIYDMLCEVQIFNLQINGQGNINQYHLEALQWVEVWTVEDFLWPRVHVHPSLRFAVCSFPRWTLSSSHFLPRLYIS